MSPRSQSILEEIRKKSRQNIVSSAMKLFAVNGYHTTKMAEIASDAKISKGLIYNYFSGKKELLDFIIQEGISEINSIFIEGDKYSDPEKRLINEIDWVFQNLETNFEFWKLFYQILMQPQISEIYSNSMRALLTGQIEKITHIYKALGSNDPELKARTLLAMLDGVGFHLIIDESYPLEAVKNFIIHYFIRETEK